MEADSSKVMYSGMVLSRFMLLGASLGYIFKGLTIATRYSLLRKQFRDADNNEIRIYDYQLQKEKLFTILAQAYAMASCVPLTQNLVSEVMSRAQNKDFSMLKTCHLKLSGYKAVFSRWVTTGMTTLIQACGGHGYSHFSGLPHLMVESFADTIQEGENSVLVLQISRELVKSFQKISVGRFESVDDEYQYLRKFKELSGWVLPMSKQALGDGQLLIQLFEKISVNLTKDASSHLFEKVSEGMDPKTVSSPEYFP